MPSSTPAPVLPPAETAGDPAEATLAAEPARFRWARAVGMGRAGRRRASVEARIGSVLLGIIVLGCVVVPLVSPFSTDAFVASPFQAPSWAHPFGTDSYGRDLFVRVFAGGRIDLVTALVCIAVPVVCGTVVGILVGMSSSRAVDTVAMRLIDGVMAFPFVILILALVVILGTTTGFGPLPPGLPSLFLAVFIVGWAIYARLARVETLALRGSDYILAARLLGFSTARILIRHIAPRVFRTTANYGIAEAVLIIATTASLPFLGAGVQPPAPEWGNILYEGRTVLGTAWWMSLFPGLLCALTGVAISLIADAALSRGRGAR